MISAVLIETVEETRLCSNICDFRNRVEFYSRYSRVIILTGLPPIVFEICGGIIEFLEPNDGVVSSDRGPNLGIAVGRSARTTNLNAHTRYLQNIRGKYVDQPTRRRCDTLPHPRVDSAEPPWLQTAYFQKCLYVQDVL